MLTSSLEWKRVSFFEIKLKIKKNRYHETQLQNVFLITPKRGPLSNFGTKLDLEYKTDNVSKTWLSLTSWTMLQSFL